MTADSEKQPAAKRAASRKPRKNARPNKTIIVVPEGGLEPLKAKIGDPFPPMNLRQLLDQARHKNPANVDDAFRKIVAQKTAEQIATLLSRLGLEPTDPDAPNSAFAVLAMALCGVGQVAWTPAPRQSDGWTAHHESTLYWLVKSLCENEELTEHAAVRRIADDAFLHRFFPYRPHELRRDAILSEEERRFQSLRQAWTKVKAKEEQFLASDRPQLIDAILGGNPGYWEVKLLGLDIADAAPRSSKNPAR